MGYGTQNARSTEGFVVTRGDFVSPDRATGAARDHGSDGGAGDPHDSLPRTNSPPRSAPQCRRLRRSSNWPARRIPGRPRWHLRRRMPRRMPRARATSSGRCPVRCRICGAP
jgi:hypothetical protein